MTFDQATLPDSPSAISSQESGSGPTPCPLLGGLTIGQFGPALAPANLSATQATALGLLMSGTSGPRGSSSSRSADLQRCLESRLRARTASVGSTLFTLTWKQRATPSGLLICALRASARRISDSDCGSQRDWKGATLDRWGDNARPLNEVAVLAGWPTPNATVIDAKPNPPVTSHRRPSDPQISVADVAVHLAGWPTPTTTDSVRSPSPNFTTLNHAAVLAGWPTPMAGTPAQNGNNAAANNDSSRRTVALCPDGPARLTATGLLLTGSSAETPSGGQLRPGHSRWLMALPSAWDDCGVTAMALLRQRPKRSSRRTLTPKGARHERQVG